MSDSKTKMKVDKRKTEKKGNPPKDAYADQPKLKGLTSPFKGLVVEILKELAGKGWKPFVAEGVRTKAQQRVKVQKGYSKTMNSRHITGHAVDIVDRRYGWGGKASKLDFQFWTDLGAAANARGLEWGGDWKSFKDVAHVQVPWKGIRKPQPPPPIPTRRPDPPKVDIPLPQKKPSP